MHKFLNELQLIDEELFSYYAGEGDRMRDVRYWEAAYWNYRKALDIKRLDAGFLVQIGHMAKEMRSFECAEAYYRSALICGAEYKDVMEHLVHVSNINNYFISDITLMDWVDRVKNIRGDGGEILLFDDVVILVIALRLEQKIGVGDVLRWLRSLTSPSMIVGEMMASHQLSFASPYWLQYSSLGAVPLRGMPRWREVPVFHRGHDPEPVAARGQKIA